MAEEAEDCREEDEEEALIALVEHRTKEVEHLRKRISYYNSQLQDSEKRLHDSQSKLARIRRRKNDSLSRESNGPSPKKIKEERRSVSPIQTGKSSIQNQPRSKPQLVISRPEEKVDVARSSHSDRKPKEENLHSQLAQTKSQKSGVKRKIECKEHNEVISLIKRESSPSLLRCNASTHISSQHKRKMRSLILCPVNGNLFMTSALDGVVNLWQLEAKGSGASLLSATECLSPKQRRWPEDVSWHPGGNSIFAAYSADGGDNQISIIDLNKTHGRDRVTFLEEKPHVKGIVNSIMFMPWNDVSFVTGGSDHAVVHWNEKDREDHWKPKALHRNLHTSAVMGVAGLYHKQVVLSAGADKRIIGFDLLAGRADYKHQIESKCMSVLPNPSDFNLFMVQTGAPERQLRLFDARVSRMELHAFGWKQESSESQSALINQAWSPDGLYITSGSADPMIHIFDIRYTSHKPSQSVKAHQKRVFKASWHSSYPLLISISSDLNIGLHKIS